MRSEGRVVNQLQDVVDIFFTKILERGDIVVACIGRNNKSPVRRCLAVVYIMGQHADTIIEGAVCLKVLAVDDREEFLGNGSV